jgi:superfamily I DNA/RNA helicase
LFLCHSNALRDYIALAFTDTDLVEVKTFQTLCGELMAMGKVPDPRTPGMRGAEYWEVERPMAALEALMAMDSPPSFDALIIDEAQDLMTGPAKDVLDVVVRGGWQEGAWRVFLDPQQDVFAANNRQVVEGLANHGLRYRLSLNCRNTSEIARDTAIATGRRLTETLPINGPQPVWLRYHDEKDQRKLAAKQLRAWLEAGIRPEQIAILSPRRRDNSVFADGLPPGVPARLVDGPLITPSDHPRAIQFSTVAAFKGLEADAVLVLDAHLGDVERAETIYVGMSRARSLLAVMRSSRLDLVWADLQEAFGRRLLEASLHR